MQSFGVKMLNSEELTTKNLENEIEIENNLECGMPTIAVRGKVIFPNVFTTIDVGRIKTLNAIQKALKGDKRIFAVCQKDVRVDEPSTNDLCSVGTVCKIGSLNKLGQDNFKLTIEGLYRAEAVSVQDSENYFVANVKKIVVENNNELETEALLRVCKTSFRSLTDRLVKPNRDAINTILSIDNAEAFLNSATFNAPLKENEKQRILETYSLAERLLMLSSALNNEIEVLNIEKEIAERVKKNIDKNQKEFYLREQIKAIHEELGDDVKENDVLKEAILKKGLSKEVELKVLEELKRMSKMAPSSPDYTVLRSYLDWILDLPFNEESEDTKELSVCKKTLEEDHFGLEKVKERILEYLAVLKLTKSLKGPILCLVGPPGVGKTSVAKSVARALNRKLVRMSLGGVKDEAEIRGHRKTYIGAMPGRIIYGMKEAGTINPVFLLDEIDKLSSDMRGDPASALLEVLDPEQNETFRDRYLEIPYDLSKVMFITTANSLDTIPAPLLDRMEVIDIAGYTEEEKVEIAKRYLIPKNATKNGLKLSDISFDENSIKEIIRGYTGEAGVRKLEQQINAICRKVAVKHAEDNLTKKQKITKKTVANYLGIRRYGVDNEIEKNGVGSATGLAWTAIGGTTITIEVALMKGKGALNLTGKLGDVMQESAKTAISFIRSHAKDYGIDSTVFETTDVHVHVPEGATPKDGPSAGITIATALLSAFTNKVVRRDIAMTGEVTLRGNVLAIGGLKEKSLAAYRLGIKTVIIPKQNVKDLEEVPTAIKEQVKFIAVSNVQEVFKTVIEGI